jgi:Uma2 family endonuclease
MKVVMIEVPEQVIEERRRKGLDRLDEMWEGVYHMVPPPGGRHQEIVDGLFALLWPYAKTHGLGLMRTVTGVRDPQDRQGNYRIPEWVFLTTDRLHLMGESGYVDEGPDVVLEVRSPGDETMEKLPFYEQVGVRELLLVDRDTRDVQVLRLVGGRLTPVSPNSDGWIYCKALRAFFKTDKGPVLRVMLELDRTEHSI